MKRLKQEERLLLNRSEFLNISGNNLVEYVMVTVKPFKIITGCIFATVSVLFFTSSLVNALDRLLHSTCGLTCGYIMVEGSGFSLWSNPFDLVFTFLSNKLGLDLFFMIMIIGY